MMQKLEYAALLTGSAGAGAMLLTRLGGKALPSGFTEQFRGGNTGAQLVTVSILLGFIGIGIVILNLMRSRRERLQLRLAAITGFVAIITVLGAMS